MCSRLRRCARLPREREVILNLVVERDEARHVVLMNDEIRKARGEVGGVGEFREAAIAEIHAARGVEDDGGLELALHLEALHVILVLPRPHAPIHRAQIIAGDVVTMVHKLDAVSEVRALMVADENPAHEPLRDQLVVGQAGENRGVEELGAGKHRRMSRDYSFGSGTDFTSSWMTFTVSMPSASAAKFGMRR